MLTSYQVEYDKNWGHDQEVVMKYWVIPYCASHIIMQHGYLFIVSVSRWLILLRIGQLV